MPAGPWYVYLALCADETLYCGIARDVKARIAQHDAGRGARYTRGRGPLRVLATRRCREHGLALRIEYLVKQLAPAEKRALAAAPGGFARLARKARRAALLLVVLAAFVSTLGASSVARAESPAKLRIVTWNVWGVPAITTHLDERFRAVPDAVAALEPDLVFFQELWQAKQAESVARRLSERGFAHFRRFESPDGLTGLAVASKLPLGEGTFRPFAIGRMPHSAWHLDWLVSKGLASVLVETPLGMLRVEDTHLQAQYRGDRYDAERLAQAAEVVLLNRGHTGEPLVVAGDFNGRGDELPRRLIRDLGALEDARPTAGEDSVYARSGQALSIRILSAHVALGEPMPLGDGLRARLSDHVALVVDLELSHCTECSPPRRATGATRSAAVASLERAADVTPFRVTLSLLTAAALAVLGVGWRRRVGRFRSGSRRRVALRLAGFALLAAGFVWTSYLGVAYYPFRASVLRHVASELAVPF